MFRPGVLAEGTSDPRAAGFFEGVEAAIAAQTGDTGRYLVHSRRARALFERAGDVMRTMRPIEELSVPAGDLTFVTILTL